MTDTIGYGREKRRQGNLDCLNEKITFRDSFRDMMDSVTRPYDQCIQYLVDNIKLDPGFAEFFQWSLENNIPVVVLSSGMEPIIKALLEKLVGPSAKKMQVLANDVGARPGKDINQEGGWEILFRHPESGFGHDKSIELRKYSSLPAESRPVMFYAGDGVSDLSAARETDLLFAKKGHDLINYCAREDVPFTVFEDWTNILSKCKQIVEGKTTVQAAAQEGFEAYKSGAAGVNLKEKTK
jgi:2,3-diketo-5-methylthio-1-phosphopentane phosphatase